MQHYKVVIVSGIIGSGKSTLAEELAGAIPPSIFLSEPDERSGANPFLDRFYADKPRWSYTMQTRLLARRLRQHLRAQWHVMDGGGNAVLDSSYFQDTSYARLQFKRGDMSPEEFDTYRSLYQEMTASVLLPNVCVRILVSPEVAAERIRKRAERREGRRCEMVIDLDYLRDLDTEITHMVNVLRHQGALVVDVPWDADRDTVEKRSETVRSLADTVISYAPPDFFLDLHRRTT